jgi:replication factor C large subunit
VWVDKYRPKQLVEMVGNEEARTAVATWLKGWKPGDKAVLLVGPPGAGKTTFVNLLAKERSMNIVDLNASDTRTKDKLNKRIGEAIQTVSLYGERSLIFLDEVDGLLGRSDYGGVEFIKDAVKSTQNPIIMAANDPDADEIKKLGAACIAIRFKPPPPREVELYLRRITEAEGLRIDDDRLRDHVKRSGGDIRNAINSLQSGGESHAAGFKDVSSTVSQGLNAFFEAPDSEAALSALKSIRLPPIEKIREIYRCVLKAPDLPPAKRALALEVISRADMLMGKISRTREWRMLRYLDSTLAHELQPVLRGESVRYVTEDLPFTTLLRIWNDSKKVKELSTRYALRAHTSGSSARTQDLPYVFALASKKAFREELERVLDLDETFDKFLQKEAGRS